MSTTHNRPRRAAAIALIAGSLGLALPALGQGTPPAARPVPSSTSGATPPSLPTPKATAKERNAALEYVKARELLELNKEFNEVWLAEYKSGHEEPPSERLAIALEDNQDLISRVIAASRVPHYDMQIRYEEGFNVLLPHLGHCRQFARILVADARRLANAGRSDDAAERLTACLRISRHLVEDRVLISSLVSIAIASLANRYVEIMAVDGVLTDHGRGEYIKAARAFLTRDPFGIKACLATERSLALNSMKPHIEGRGALAGKNLAAELKELQLSKELGSHLEPLSEDQLNEQLDLMNRYYAALISAWDLPDADTRLAEIGVRLEKGDFGVLTKEVGPALVRCRISQRKAIKETTGLIALLEADAAPRPVPEAVEAPTGE